MAGFGNRCSAKEVKHANGASMRKHLGSLARLGVFVACMAYVLWDIDLRKLGADVAGYDHVAMLLALLVSLLAYLALGARLNFMMPERPGVRACTSASLLALGVNNIVPAKLGELAKVVYLNRRCGLPMPRLLGLLFWERFADLNAVLVIAVVTLAMLGVNAVLVVPLALVGAVWCALVVLRRWPDVVSRIVALLPGEKLRAFTAQLGDSVRDGLHGRGAVRSLVGGTLLVWMLYAASNVLVMLQAASLPISPAAALAVFAVASLGMAIPATPGGVGVYEAAMVVALGWFDVPRADALAVALATHMMQFLPTTLGGVAVMVRSGVRVRGLERSIERRRNVRPRERV